MHKTFILLLIIAGMTLSGCIRLVHEIKPEFQSGGTVNIHIRTDSDDPKVNVTVDDVQMDLEQLKALIEKKIEQEKKKQ